MNDTVSAFLGLLIIVGALFSLTGEFLHWIVIIPFCAITYYAAHVMNGKQHKRHRRRRHHGRHRHHAAAETTALNSTDC